MVNILKGVPQVLVLLSTHNGEKYIEELLESLLQQKLVNLKILVRDDASSDRTVQILKSYSAHIILLELDYNNVGPDISYKILIEKSANFDYDYIAFCDQDDVWMPDKLIRAIQKMEEMGKSFYSSKRLRFNRNVRTAKLFPKYDRIQTFETAAFENLSAGCTIVMERVHLLRLLSLDILETEASYDHAISLSSVALNQSYFDQEARIFYRIHERNAIGLPGFRSRTFSQTALQIDRKVYLLKQVWKKLDVEMNKNNIMFCENFFKDHSISSRIKWLFSLPKLRHKYFENIVLKTYLLFSGRKGP